LTAATHPALRIGKSGLELRVRLTPKSASDRVEGVCESADGPAIAARVTAVPADGEANTALERLMADWLDLPKSSVALTAGHKSRIKTVTISGDINALCQRVVDLLALPILKKQKN
jgi:uncharacterized protein